MIDRVYAEALKMHQRLKEAEDLAGITEPTPKPKKAIWTGWVPTYANPDNYNLEPVHEPKPCFPKCNPPSSAVHSGEDIDAEDML